MVADFNKPRSLYPASQSRPPNYLYTPSPHDELRSISRNGPASPAPSEASSTRSSRDFMYDWIMEAMAELNPEGTSLAQIFEIIWSRKRALIMARSKEGDTEEKRITSTKNTIANYLSMSPSFETKGRNRWVLSEKALQDKMLEGPNSATRMTNTQEEPFQNRIKQHPTIYSPSSKSFSPAGHDLRIQSPSTTDLSLISPFASSGPYYRCPQESVWQSSSPYVRDDRATPSTPSSSPSQHSSSHLHASYPKSYSDVGGLGSSPSPVHSAPEQTSEPPIYYTGSGHLAPVSSWVLPPITPQEQSSPFTESLFRESGSQERLASPGVIPGYHSIAQIPRSLEDPNFWGHYEQSDSFQVSPRRTAPSMISQDVQHS